MGTATAGTSPASEAGYAEAKKLAHEAFQDDDVRRAVDIGLTAGLAVQPNGPAKLATYSHLKYAGTFSQAASEKGVEEGLKVVGKSYVSGEMSGIGAGGVIDQSQQVIGAATEEELVSKGVEKANKNLGPPSEQAMKDTLGAIMASGADALTDPNEENE